MKIKSFLIGLFFLVVGLFTLSDYGINWDEPVHFFRGETYVHYFLTGKKDYKDLPAFKKYYQKDDTIFFHPLDREKSQIPSRSMYQDNQIGFKYFETDYGHPPLSDIFASIFNVVLFQKLRLINDPDSFHIYSLFLAAILVGVVFYWVSKNFGKFAGFISILSLSLYPLFFAESHNNIKDVPEAVYYSLTIITFYEAVVKKKPLWIIGSAILCGFALSTKFNAVFLPFIIVPWLLFYFTKPVSFIRMHFTLIPSLIMFPVITIGIFIVSWPYLWKAPVAGFLNVVSYYKQIGTNSSFDPHFITFFGLNNYAVKWIVYSTPLVILSLFVTGVIVVLKRRFQEKEKITFLILLWFFLPVARVSMPNSGIYGGVRQIMEYIPAMAILAGIGGQAIKQILENHFGKKDILFSFIVVALFFPIIVKLISIHPNESVYFNPIIGGLSGAKQKGLPEWGQSLGNPNKQAIQWINKNADKNAKIATNFGLGSSIPDVFIRSDIFFSNSIRSASRQKGEYILGLTHQSGFEDTYFFQYLDTFLNPVNIVSVDGVPILKIWKNDSSHTRLAYRNPLLITEKPSINLSNTTLNIDLGKDYFLTSLDLRFNKKDCIQDEDGSLDVVTNQNQKFPLDGTLRAQTLLPFFTYQGDTFTYYFSAKKARYIRINFESEKSCFKNVQKARVFGFENKPI